ncbi:MAG: Gfo/Idh/MocA family oxidoreductase [bacterium]
MKLQRTLKMGMIGGGPDAFIGEVHRKAARMDGGVDIVAGVFSRNAEKSHQTGQQLLLDPKRIYTSYEELIAKERQLPEGERVDFVALVTPNNSHFPIAKALLESGFHVMCEKPMTFNVDEARELQSIVQQSVKVFGLMHNYTGYPMVKLARDIVRNGELGEIRKIVVQYPQGWLSTPLEQTGNVQAVWRTDPAQSGGGGALGDIGTHGENLSEYITGLKITHVCADLTSFVPGRKLDDDCNCLLRFENGAKGLLHVSQIAIGEENNLAIWIYGTKKSLEWHQEHPNHLTLKALDGPMEVYRRGNPYIGAKSAAAARATRLPFGHPEAFIEAFANIYCNFTDTVRAALTGQTPDPLIQDFPNVNDGLRGMLFIQSVLTSATSSQKWTPMST